ncbi:MAG: hypothetical protein V7642_5198 [Burkholderiales bacterium]|jgi:hypothetical protein
MRQRRTVEETAVILAVILKRSGLDEARISDQTIRLVSGRKRLEGSFRQNLKDELVEYGLEIVRFDNGDQALVRVSALEAANAVTATNTLKPEELEKIRAGDPVDLKQMLNELGDDGPEMVQEEMPLPPPVHHEVRHAGSGAGAQK